MNKGKDQIMKNMEFLMKELHKEWERSGKTRAVVIINVSQTEAVNKHLVDVIQKNTGTLGDKDLDFEESVAYTRENYVLLRMLKKVKVAEDKVKERKGEAFFVELDKEEDRLFQDIIGAEEDISFRRKQSEDFFELQYSFAD